ncbi:MAG: hypothetical protein K6T87_16195 [Roseiflexus sp.]|uniref:hypothetical protein n=1 Tax=Roseiflexus sp. TaxID=2562120 RepID=UPI0025D0F375|nr:hypothetical protein [Roseiflexus sp.]MCL6542098.1 hypothetical protein [Roseiflexus sp.]
MGQINQREDYCDWRRIPPDLWPRILKGYEDRTIGARERPPQPYLGVGIYLGRAFQGRRIGIGPSPTLIVQSGPALPYMILNPSQTVGLTTTGKLFSGTVNSAGNTQNTPLGVANYLNLHLFLNVTSVTGVWDFIAQALNPQTLTWADTQLVFSGISANGDYYATVGQLGVVTDFAVRWNPTSAGSITFSLSYALKEGTVGSSTGLSKTIFIGSNNGVSTESGYPILEGHKEVFIVGEGAEVWGISYVPLQISVFQL